MKNAKHRKAFRALESRQKLFDKLPEKIRQTARRPGSLNAKKGNAFHSTHK